MPCSWMHDGAYVHDLQMLNACVTAGCYTQNTGSYSCEVGRVALIPLKRSVSLGTQRAQGLQKNVRIDNGVKALYMKRK
jgi:hypothetical protein